MSDSRRAVMSYLMNEYVTSEVVSGEFIHSCPIPGELLGFKISLYDAIKGVQEFLDFDDSEETFDLVKIGNVFYTTDFNFEK